MPRDYANKSTRKKSTSRKRRAPARSNTRKSSVLFHGPSFSFGAIIGAALVITAAYAPEWLADRRSANSAELVAAETEAAPQVQYEFPDLLRNTDVAADPEPYAVPEPPPEAANLIHTIQVASFRQADEADTLRGQLILGGMAAQTIRVSDRNGTWYRVMVGPFERKIDADRAVTRLREQGYAPIRRTSSG